MTEATQEAITAIDRCQTLDELKAVQNGLDDRWAMLTKARELLTGVAR